MGAFAGQSGHPPPRPADRSTGLPGRHAFRAERARPAARLPRDVSARGIPRTGLGAASGVPQFRKARNPDPESAPPAPLLRAAVRVTRPGGPRCTGAPLAAPGEGGRFAQPALSGRRALDGPGSLEGVIDLRLLREDPDRVRASQRARGEDVALVDALLSADERRRSSGVRFDELRSEQKSLGKLIPKATGDEKTELLKKAGELSAAVKAADAEKDEADQEGQAAPAPPGQPRPPRRAGRRRGGLRRPRQARHHPRLRRRGLRAPRPPGAGRGPRRHRRRARRQGLRLALLLPDRRRRPAGAGPGQRRHRPGHRRRLHADADARAGPPAGDGGHRLPRPGRRGRLPPGEGRLLPGRHLRGPARRVPHGRDHRGRQAAPAVRRLLPVLPPRGRYVRQGHPGHLPRPPVRQGRDVLVRRA